MSLAFEVLSCAPSLSGYTASVFGFPEGSAELQSTQNSKQDLGVNHTWFVTDDVALRRPLPNSVSAVR